MFTRFCGMIRAVFAMVFLRRSSSSSWEVPSSDWALKGSIGDDSSVGEGERACVGGGGDMIPEIP